MRMPRRADFDSGQSFLSAMDRWKQQGDEAYASLRAMYDVTPEFSDRPIWLDQSTVRHIGWEAFDDEEVEGNLERRLRVLSGSVAEDDLKVTRLCHGKVDHEEGFPYRGIYVEVAHSGLSN